MSIDLKIIMSAEALTMLVIAHKTRAETEVLIVLLRPVWGSQTIQLFKYCFNKNFLIFFFL